MALARALVLRPKVLLLDEPLGALDLKLREEMQGELKTLQRSLGLTFVFVTHDQGEALSMADRVAVFNDGRIVQVGTPEEIYERPRDRFVADFVGGSNVIEPALVKAWTGVERAGEPAAGENRAASTRPRRRARISSCSTARIAEVLYHGAVKRIELVTAEAGRASSAPSRQRSAPAAARRSRRASPSRGRALHLMELE